MNYETTRNGLKIGSTILQEIKAAVFSKSQEMSEHYNIVLERAYEVVDWLTWLRWGLKCVPSAAAWSGPGSSRCPQTAHRALHL